jgi:hypothetical protein
MVGASCPGARDDLLNVICTLLDEGVGVCEHPLFVFVPKILVGFFLLPPSPSVFIIIQLNYYHKTR